MFQSGGMKNEINTLHRRHNARQVPDIANMEAYGRVVELVAHVMLLFFVTAEHDNMAEGVFVDHHLDQRLTK